MRPLRNNSDRGIEAGGCVSLLIIISVLSMWATVLKSGVEGGIERNYV